MYLVEYLMYVISPLDDYCVSSRVNYLMYVISSPDKTYLILRLTNEEEHSFLAFGFDLGFQISLH